MGLKIYETADPGSAFSADGLFTNAMSFAFDGVRGAVLIRRFYVRNDNVNFSYDDTKVQPVLISGDNIIDGSNDFSWKLIAGDPQPLDEQWDLVNPANQIDIPDIGTLSVSDIATFEPFWLRIRVPQNAAVTSYEGIKLRISTTEIAV